MRFGSGEGKDPGRGETPGSRMGHPHRDTFTATPTYGTLLSSIPNTETSKVTE
jgi:hypothetical protein